MLMVCVGHDRVTTLDLVPICVMVHHHGPMHALRCAARGMGARRHEWMRNFSVELLRQSPSAALRECCKLAQVGERGRASGAGVEGSVARLVAGKESQAWPSQKE
jgi:hypothetical protein